jgi:hypothetical protein
MNMVAVVATKSAARVPPMMPRYPMMLRSNVAPQLGSLGQAGCMIRDSSVRARDTRAFIVPTGTPQISAASS